MAEYDYPNLTLHARLVHDELTEEEKRAKDPRQPGAPALEVGVEIEGVFVPILRRRSAAGLHADIERAKQAQAEPAAEG